MSRLRLIPIVFGFIISQPALAETFFTSFSYNYHQLDDSRIKSSQATQFGLGYKLYKNWQLELSYLDSGDFKVKSSSNQLTINSSQIWLRHQLSLPWKSLKLQSKVGWHRSRLTSPQAVREQNEYGFGTGLALVHEIEPGLEANLGLQALDNIDKKNQLISIQAGLAFYF